MLIKMMNTKNFEVKRRIFVIVGIVFLVLGTAEIILKAAFNVTLENGFIDGFFMGAGIGLIIAGLFFIIYFGLILKNKEKLKKAEIETLDERNRLIVMRTGFISFIVSIFAQYAVLIITAIINITVFYIVLAFIAAELVIVLIVWIIVNKVS